MSDTKLITKTDLINNLAAEVGISKKAATDIFETVLDEISTSLSKGYKIQIPGFGSWQTKTRAARVGRNPKTGEQIQIPESVLVSFSAGSKLKASVASVKKKKK